MVAELRKTCSSENGLRACWPTFAPSGRQLTNRVPHSCCCMPAFAEATSRPTHRCTRDVRCSCDCIKNRCPADVHAQACTRAAPFLHAREDPRHESRIEEAASALGRALERSAARRPCIWDDTEVLLKASVYSDERVLITGWVLAWLRSLLAARTCAPRLHVVSDLPGRYRHALRTLRLTHSPHPLPRPDPHHPNLSEEASAFRGLFRNVPNLSFHTLRYPVAMDPFYAIQWPMMWADNFTVA